MKETTDVWFSAFLVSKGHEIADYDVISRGKVRCKFKISESDWQKLKLEFNKSEISKFKSIIESIKDMAF